MAFEIMKKILSHSFLNQIPAAMRNRGHLGCITFIEYRQAKCTTLAIGSAGSNCDTKAEHNVQYSHTLLLSLSLCNELHVSF